MLHVLAGTHDLVDEEELLGEDWGDVHELTLDDVVVPDVGGGGWERLA